MYPNLSGLWDLINMMANTAFVFLPALVGWSATSVLVVVNTRDCYGINACAPSLIKCLGLWKSSDWFRWSKIEYFNILGLFQIEKVGYQGQILPVLVAAFVLSKVEIFLRNMYQMQFNC